MQFCGQMPFCTAFNSRQAMEEAKKNVEVRNQVVVVIVIIVIIAIIAIIAIIVIIVIIVTIVTITIIMVMEVSYPVVGVVELWEETLEVLEHTLPFFFKGAAEMYAKKKKEV